MTPIRPSAAALAVVIACCSAAPAPAATVNVRPPDTADRIHHVEVQAKADRWFGAAKRWKAEAGDRRDSARAWRAEAQKRGEAATAAEARADRWSGTAKRWRAEARKAAAAIPKSGDAPSATGTKQDEPAAAKPEPKRRPAAAKPAPAKPAPAKSEAGAGESTPLDLDLDERGEQLDAAGGGGGGLVRTFIGLAVVLAVIYGLYWVLRQVKTSREDRAVGQGLATEASVPLGPNRSLHLVRAGRELVLVGTGDHGVTPIRTYTEDEAREAGFLTDDDDPDDGDDVEGTSAKRPVALGARVGALVDGLRRRTVRS